MSYNVKRKNSHLFVVYVVLLTIIVFNPALVFLPKGLYLSRIVSPVLLYIALFRCSYIVHCSRSFSMVLLLLYVSWVTLMTFSINFEDVMLFSHVLTLSFHVCAIYWPMAVIAKEWNIGFEKLMTSFLIVISIQCFFVVLEYWNPAFKSLTIQLLGDTTGNIDYVVQGRRARGFSGGGASTSAFFAIGILLVIFYTVNWISSQKYSGGEGRMARRGIRGIPILSYNVFSGISLFLILGGMLYTGRTGFLILPLAVCYVVLICGILRKYRIMVGICILLVGIYSVYLFIPDIYIKYSSAYERFLRGFNFSDGLENSILGDFIQDHVFFPNDFFTIFFGDVRTYNVDRIPSDIGYIRRLFGYGIVGCILFYGFVVSMISGTIKRTADSSGKMLWVFVLIWLFIAESKSPMMSKFTFMSFICITYFHAIAKSKYTKKDYHYTH